MPWDPAPPPLPAARASPPAAIPAPAARQAAQLAVFPDLQHREGRRRAEAGRCVSAMELRNGSLVGGSAAALPPHARPAFEEAVGLVFQRWTALSLAVDNQWGGARSRELAEGLYAQVLHWFYANKGQSNFHAYGAQRLVVVQAGLASTSVLRSFAVV